jgi:hypothetical protein
VVRSRDGCGRASKLHDRSAVRKDGTWAWQCRHRQTNGTLQNRLADNSPRRQGPGGEETSLGEHVADACWLSGLKRATADGCLMLIAGRGGLSNGAEMMSSGEGWKGPCPACLDEKLAPTGNPASTGIGGAECPPATQPSWPRLHTYHAILAACGPTNAMPASCIHDREWQRPCDHPDILSPRLELDSRLRRI